MFCRKCGAAIPEGARFCRECGAPVSQQPQTPQPAGPAASGIPGMQPTPTYAVPTNPGWSPAATSSLDKVVFGKLTIRDCLFVILALMVVICMLSRWVSIPLADIAQDIDDATGGYGASSELEGLGDLKYGVPGLGDMASSAKATLDLLEDSGLDDLGDVVDVKSMSRAAGSMGFITFMWAIGLIAAIAGATARLCGKKPYVFVAGMAICAFVSLVMMVCVAGINGGINDAIASEASSYGADLDVSITWVKVTAAPIITLIASLAAIALSVLDLQRKR